MIPQTVDWFIVRNDPKEKFQNNMEFHVIDGTPRPTDKYKSFIGTASFHHAAGLNQVCYYLAEEKLHARYVLLMDPDFFIVPRLDMCVDYMRANNLAFFGAPYAIEPKKKRIQGFPVAFCMFIDTEQVDLASLNFMPRCDVPGIVADTGYDIYKKYINSDLKYEAVLPHFVGDTKAPHIGRSLSSAYGIVPSQPIDQYFWNKKIFGVHCHMKLHLREGKELARRAILQTTEIKRIIKNTRIQDGVDIT